MTSAKGGPVAPDEPPLLLDTYLSEYEGTEFHACVVDADAKTTWEAIKHADLSLTPVVRALLLLRAVPGRVKALASGQAAPSRPPFTFDDMPRVGFELLGERPGEIVFGSVSKPWKLGDEQPLAVGRSSFADFDQPGYTKIAFSIRAEPYGAHRTLVTTETRTATTDARSRRRFAAYWKLIGPFSALIRRVILRQLKSDVETTGPTRKATGGAAPLPLTERVKTRFEHEADTRSVGLGVWILRLTKGRIARLWHRQVLILTTQGRKSGRARAVPLQFFPDGDRMVVVAANSGLPSPPGWYFNLTARPQAQVEVLGRTLQVHAEELSVDEVAAFWPRVLQAAPDYVRYPNRTSRRIPLIRLIPVK